ncbi:MAG: potassium channel family protein [Chitinophagales bacterium]
MASLVNNHFFRIVKHRFTQRFLIAALIFIIAIASGIIGYIFIEGYTLTEAFYMTIITISTVGYGEIRPLSAAGKTFTSFLIIFNIGAVAYAISVVSSFIIEGDFKTLFKETQMEKVIENLKDHVIICGYGRLGKVVCADIAKSGKSILIVEKDDELIEELKSKGILYFQGDATQDETIKKIGIERADTIITTLHSDAANVFIVLAARELNNTAKIISRASEEANVSKLKRAGANNIIIPEDIGGAYMAAIVGGKENISMSKWGY